MTNNQSIQDIQDTMVRALEADTGFSQPLPMSSDRMCVLGFLFQQEYLSTPVTLRQRIRGRIWRIREGLASWIVGYPIGYHDE